jgi:hypothetical protein
VAGLDLRHARARIVVFAWSGAFEAGRERKGLDPLVTPSLFRTRAFTGGLVLGLVFFAALVGTGLILTLYLQIGPGWAIRRSRPVSPRCRRRWVRWPDSSRPAPGSARSSAASCCSSARRR